MAVRTTPLVGRDRELAALDDSRSEATNGSPGMVLVGGDAGVGKTRFVEEVVKGAAEDDWVVLNGGCVQLSEGAATLAPVAEVLRQLARARGDAAVVELLDGPARWLAPLVPELTVDLDSPQEAAPGQMLVSFHRLLRDLADEAPVLLVLEDLHWAGATTRDLVGHLAARLHDERLLVLGTVRTDDLDRRHPLRPVLAELVRRPAVTRIDLGPLTEAALTEHLSDLSPDRTDAQLLDVVRRAGGNPFFAEELLTADAGELPNSVHDALSLRLERLPRPTRQLLSDIAVVGAAVDARLVGRVARLHEADVEAALRAALDDGILVVDDGRYAFRHALLREVAADRLLPTERVRAHAAAAAALEEHPELAAAGRAAAAGEAAHHWWRAHDLPRCLAASVRAASEHTGLQADAAALEHATRALELWDRVEDPEGLSGTTEVDLLLAATSAALGTSDPAASELARAARTAAVRAADDHARAAAAGNLTVALLNANDHDAALEVAADELARHGDAVSAARSLALSAHAQTRSAVGEDRLLDWDVSAVAEEFDEAIDIARACDGDQALELGLLRMVNAIGPYLPDRLEEPLEELFNTLDRTGHDRYRPNAHLTATERCLATRDLERAAAELARWDRHAARAGRSEQGTAWRWWCGLTLDLHRGRFEGYGARVDVRDPRDLTGSWLATGVVVVTGEWLRWTGQVRRAVDRAAFAIDVVDDTNTVGALVAAEYAAALAADGAAVEEVVAAANRGGRSPGSPVWHYALARAVVAVGVAAGGTTADEAVLADVDDWIDRLVTYVDRLHDDAPLRGPATTSLHHTRAVRAELAGESDPVLWDPVVTGYAREGLVVDAAIARIGRARARAFADDGPSTAAEGDLLAAWEAVTDRDLSALRDDVAALARRLRVTLPGAEADDECALPELTPREREVLGLVAEGWTNKKVGEHLFISPKTVSVHMSNAMRKLEVDSRTEAVAVAHRAGLLTEA